MGDDATEYLYPMSNVGPMDNATLGVNIGQIHVELSLEICRCRWTQACQVPYQMRHLARQQQQQQQQQQKRPPPQLIVLVVPGWVHSPMMEGQPPAESPPGCLAGLRLEEQGPCLPGVKATELIGPWSHFCWVIESFSSHASFIRVVLYDIPPPSPSFSFRPSNNSFLVVALTHR